MRDQKKLNILVINRWIGYNEGGNETHTKELVHWLNKRGHNISVLTTKGDALKDLDERVKVYYVKSPKEYFSYALSGLFYAFFFNLKAFLKFVSLYLKGERYDVLSIHFSLEANLARLLRMLFGVPYVIRLAGDTDLELIEARRADGKIQVSEFMNAQGKKYGVAAEVIPKGTDFSKFNPDFDVSNLRKELNIKDKKVLLAVCRLDPRKNLITLVKAMDILINQMKRKDLYLIIVGDGVERDYLEKNVDKYNLGQYVKFTGMLPNSGDLLPRYYALADLFVLPTLYEGYGWVFLEAMASGLPILTTDAGSNPEVVGGIGKLVEVKKPDVFAKAIIELIDDPETLQKMAKKGLEKAKSQQWEEVIKKYEAYYIKTSKNKCNSIKCKLTALFHFFYDWFFIIKSLLKFKVVSKNKRKDEPKEFNVKGQVGAQN